MPRNPVSMTLPPFYGTTRRIILAAVVVFFAALLLSLTSAGAFNTVAGFFALIPERATTKMPWQLFTYPFINSGLFSMLFAALSFWFFGSALESERGGLWLGEYFVAATAGGGLLASILSRTIFSHEPSLSPASVAAGLWPAVMAVILAYARFHPDEELTFNFILRLRAKYLAAIYLLVYLALAITGNGRFDAMVVICAAISGFLFLRFAPQRGLRFAFSERMYGIRNAYYRRKRQQAAKKFTVYMKKQGKDVSIDSSGRYVSLDDERRDSNDKSWMN